MKITRHYIFYILFLFVISGYSFPQTEIKNFVGLNFGGSDFRLKDEHASPLIFGSIGIAPSLQYLYKGEVNRHYFEASYFYDRLTSLSDNFLTDNNRGRIRYSYFHSITNFNVLNERISLFLGGSISTFLSHGDYLYKWISPSYTRSIESWYWCNSLDLSAQFEYNRSSKEFFSLKLFIPVISNISRPNYSPSADYNYIDNDWKFKMIGETGFFPDDFSLNTLLSYQRPLFWKFNLQLDYEFYYSFCKEPKDVSMFMNNIRAGLFYCF